MAEYMPLTNLRGPAARITSVTAETVPADQPIQVDMAGLDQNRSFHFKMPRGLPGVNAVANDEATAAYIAARDTKTRNALDSAFRTADVQAAADGLRASLDAGLTTAFGGLGDSTGNQHDEWIYLVAEHVAAEYPNYTVQSVLWSDAKQDMDAPEVIQTGPAGEQYANAAAGTASRMLPLSASLHTPDVIDVRAKITLDSWAPTEIAVAVAREGGAGKRSWYFGVAPSGKLAFYYSANGSTLIADRLSDAVVGAAAGETRWIRAVFTPSVRIDYFVSTDGVTWTQLGASIAIADTPAQGAVFNAATPYEIGGRQGGRTYTGMKIYQVDIRNGLNGPPVVPLLPALWGAASGAAIPVVGAPVFTVVNGSHPGADLDYWAPARIDKALPAYGQRLGFLSLSHNELAQSGPTFIARYATKIDQVRARMPGVPLVCLPQNPQKAPRAAEFVAAQKIRRTDIIAAAASRGAVTVDTYTAINENLATNVSADGVHPTSAGSLVWRDTFLTATRL